MVLEVCKSSLGKHLSGVTEIDLFHSWFRNRALDDLWSFFLASTVSCVSLNLQEPVLFVSAEDLVDLQKILTENHFIWLSEHEEIDVAKAVVNGLSSNGQEKGGLRSPETPPQLLPHVSW